MRGPSGGSIGCGSLAVALAVAAPVFAGSTPRTAPSKPAPTMVLAVEAPTLVGPWTMRVTNEGEVPVSLAADARFLTIDVTPRGARGPTRCELPPDMRPQSELDRALVVPPKRSYVESFEPRMYCFGAAGDAIAGGSIVVAHLGWAGLGTKPPHAVWPVDGVEPELAPVGELSSAPIALPDAASPTLIGDAPATGPRLVLRAATAIDASSATNIDIPLTLRNEGSTPVTVRFRPETIAFEARGPAGAVDCPWPTPSTAPMRQLFSTVPSRGEITLHVLLGAYCAGHTFDAPGLFVVRPRLDTRKASGEVIGLRTFDGLLIADSPTLVRLRTGAAQQRLRRPALAPDAGP